MRRVAVVFLLSCSTLVACAQFGALFGAKPQPQAETPEQAAARERASAAQRQQDEQRQQQAAAEAERREQALLAELDAARGEVSAGTGDRQAAAIAFTDKVRALAGSQAAASGKVDLAVLSREAAGYLDAAMQQAPSFELLRALDSLQGPEADAAFVAACPKLRPKVPADAAIGFTGDCLKRAGGDAARLKWPGVQKDLVAYRKHEEAELKRAREEEARRAQEEAARAKEEAAMAARGASYVAASVFAAGRCNFGNCAKDGWTVNTPDGDVRVRCNFGNCLKEGWVADFPGGKSARTTCSFGDCFKDGWRTELPDGQSASTRCSFNNCPKDGWSTDIPGLGTATTRCNFQDCLKDGWTTDLPQGGQVRCRCNFQDCLSNGASCD